MQIITRLFLILLLISPLKILHAQDTLFHRLLGENMHLMEYSEGEFTGPAWDIITNEAKASQNVLIGEDHFTNEIPEFVRELAKSSGYDNFYIEVDPYTTRLLEASLNGSPAEKKEFRDKYGDILSFYTLSPEYEMLEAIHNTGAGLLGSDQIVMYDDRLLFEDLAKRTKNVSARSIYLEVAQKSKIALDTFLTNPSKPMYMITPEFQEKLSALRDLSLSDEETEVIEALALSADIYKTQSHRKRVQLLIDQLMDDYPHWKDKRNLFKYGASHMSRAESVMNIHDIGSIVAGITMGNYQKSLHIMILGESGSQSGPFSTFPPSSVEPADSYYLNYLMPLIEMTEGDQWHVFDLRPLRRALYKKEIFPDNLNMIRAITGYDLLVLIPSVTPAGFD